MHSSRNTTRRPRKKTTERRAPFGQVGFYELGSEVGQITEVDSEPAPFGGSLLPARPAAPGGSAADAAGIDFVCTASS